MKKTFLTVIAGILVGMLLSGIIWNTSRQPLGNPIELRPPPEPEPISVHIIGAVAEPGVYDIPKESRVIDAVNAAGGFLPVADQDNINLAAIVEDGVKIEIEKRAIYNTGGGNNSSGRININTASLEELDTLPGIGPATAQAIIDHRQQSGSFQRIEDITNVSGIGIATYDRIKDMISVGN